MQENFVGLEMLLEINKCDGCYIPMFFVCLVVIFFWRGGGGGCLSVCFVFYPGCYRTTLMYRYLSKQHILFYIFLHVHFMFEFADLKFHLKSLFN